MVGSKNKGINIIKKHVAKFQNIIDGLEKGISKCQEEEESNAITMGNLATENEDIRESKEKAIVFKTNLSKMLTSPDPKPESK